MEKVKHLMHSNIYIYIYIYIYIRVHQRLNFFQNIKGLICPQFNFISFV